MGEGASGLLPALSLFLLGPRAPLARVFTSSPTHLPLLLLRRPLHLPQPSLPPRLRELGTARLTCTGRSGYASGGRGSHSGPGAAAAFRTSPRPGATAGAGPAPEAAPRGRVAGPGREGGGVTRYGAGPEAGNGQKGNEGRGRAEVTSWESPAQLSRGRK